jgi:hypothetical protein
MSLRLAILITAGSFLSGCCGGNGGYVGPGGPGTSGLPGWDRFGPLPVSSKVKSAKVRKKSRPIASVDAPPNSVDASPKETELVGLKPYSREWWTVRDAIDLSYEAKLAKKLIICQNCMSPAPEDQTGSIPIK